MGRGEPGGGRGAPEPRSPGATPGASREGVFPAPGASPARPGPPRPERGEFTSARHLLPLWPRSTRAPSPGPPPSTKLEGAYKSWCRRDPRTHSAGAQPAAARSVPIPTLPRPPARPCPITGGTANTTVSAGDGQRGGAPIPDPRSQIPEPGCRPGARSARTCCLPRPRGVLEAQVRPGRSLRSQLPGAGDVPLAPAARPLSRNPRVRPRRVGPEGGEAQPWPRDPRTVPPGSRPGDHFNRT